MKCEIPAHVVCCDLPETMPELGLLDIDYFACAALSTPVFSNDITGLAR